MRNRMLLMLMGGAIVLGGPVVDQAAAAPEPPRKRPRLMPPVDIWWSHTNQDRLVPINDPSHTNQDGMDPPKDPPPLPPSGAEGDGDGPRSWRFDPSDFVDAGPDLGGPGIPGGGSLPEPETPTLRVPLGGAIDLSGGLLLSTPVDFGAGAPSATALIPGAGVLPLLGLAALAGGGGRRRRR